MSDDNKEGAGVPRKVIGYTWTQANGKHRSVGAAPHPTNAHNIEPIYYPIVATPPAAMPAAPSDAVTDGTSFLIQICGEDIDHPLTAIVPNWEGVRRFCVEHYTGSEDAENLCGNILDTLKTEFDEHEAEETGKPYIEQWEIGGLSIERVCDCTPRAALSQTMQPQAAMAVARDLVSRTLPKATQEQRKAQADAIARMRDAALTGAPEKDEECRMGCAVGVCEMKKRGQGYACPNEAMRSQAKPAAGEQAGAVAQCPNCKGTRAPSPLDPDWCGRCECAAREQGDA